MTSSIPIRRLCFRSVVLLPSLSLLVLANAFAEDDRNISEIDPALRPGRYVLLLAETVTPSRTGAPVVRSLTVDVERSNGDLRIAAETSPASRQYSRSAMVKLSDRLLFSLSELEPMSDTDPSSRVGRSHAFLGTQQAEDEVRGVFTSLEVVVRPQGTSQQPRTTSGSFVLRRIGDERLEVSGISQGTAGAESANEGIQKLKSALQKQQDDVNRLLADLEKFKQEHGIVEDAVENADETDDMVQRTKTSKIEIEKHLNQLDAKRETLTTLDRATLRLVLPAIEPREILLTELLQREAETRESLAKLSATHEADHPEVVALRQYRDRLNAQIDGGIDSIMAGIETQADAYRKNVASLTRRLEVAQAQQAERKSIFSQYFSKKRMVENARLMLDVLGRKLAQEIYDAAKPRGTLAPSLVAPTK